MNAFLSLLAILAGDLRRHPGTALASIASMTVGAGVFVGIYQAGSAARSSFVSTVEALAGRATHQVVRDAGVEPGRLPELLALEEVEAAAPVLEGLVPVLAVRRGGQTAREGLPPLRLLGVDPFLAVEFLGERREEPVVRRDDFDAFLTEPGATLLPGPWAREEGVREGDTLVVAAAGRPVELRVLAVYDLEILGEASRDTALVDVATAQETLDRTTAIDRIDLIVRDGGEDSVRAALEPGERLERPRTRGERVARMIDAFRLNLLALGSLALVVGSLLVFNAAQFSVVRRGGLLGQLRCLGVTRPLVVATVLAEVMLFGLAGGILGVALGQVLARGLTKAVARTITDLYTFVRVDVRGLPGGMVLLVVAGTIAVAAAAGLFPALDAARTPPRMVGIRSRGELRFRAQLPRLVVFGVAGTLLGFLAVEIDAGGWWMGLVASLAFLIAGATLLPPLMALLLPGLQALGERRGWLSLSLSSGALFRSLTRTGGAASALGVALSMTLGVVVMISSFEREVRRWIHATLRADLFIADSAQGLTREGGRIPAAAVDEVRATPGVRAVDTLRALELPYADRTLFFCGVELSVPESRRGFEFLEGSPETAVERAMEGAVLISEPLSNRYDLHVGDVLTLPGARGERSFPVAGVFRDFSYDRGYALTDRETFVSTFGDPGVRNLAIYLEAGLPAGEVATLLRRRFAGRFLLEVRSNTELRTRVLEIFRRTFRVTYVLQFIATLMALAGITITLLGLFIERAREIATLRALGASILSVGKLFTLESLLMAIFPILLALPLGALLAWILIDVVNLRSFGWTIRYFWPWGDVALTCALAAAAGLSATVMPLGLLRRQRIAVTLHEE